MNTKSIVQYGLSEVYTPPTAQVDIVFVHGLNGDPKRTWSTQKPDVFWPSELLPPFLEEQQCRILIYGYDANVGAFTDGASKDKIHNHAEHLASRLTANRALRKAVERPIIFVCHSLGGLVVKRCLTYCANIHHTHTERLRSLYVSTYGILFLGTPHNGSDIAKWGTLLQSICSAALPSRFFDTSPQLVEALKTNNETLQNINRSFVEIIGRFRIFFFHESKPTNLKGTMQYIVDEDSAAPVIEGVERMGIERDHSHMCKFEDENAPGYDVVAEAIQRYATDAPVLIRARWDEERHHRELERERAATEILGDSAHYNAAGGQRVGGPLTSTSARGSNTTSMTSSINSVKLISNSFDPPLVAPLGFRPNSFFVGFELELHDVEQKLQSKKRRDIGTCSVLVFGPPGSGKSYLVREYVWRHRHEYPSGVFWVDCKTRDSTYKSFYDIAQVLGVLSEFTDGGQSSVFVDFVRNKLKSQHGWLMVFDGVSFDSDSEIEQFIRFIPDQQGNNIIFTSVDKTLARRQRLLNPSAVKVRPLSEVDACTLLYKSLNIQQPTSQEEDKALQLVKHYECLPLAIHAAAHVLIARGRRLEHFSPVISDSRLQGPYNEIVSLLQASHKEAYSLLVALSFLEHHVPVALLRYGRAGLDEIGVEIRSPTQDESTRKELDESIAILIRYGMIERGNQHYITSSPRADSSSPEHERHDPEIPSPHEPADDSVDLENVITRVRTSSTKSIAASIDTLRIHTVVQKIIHDHLRYKDTSFWSELCIATRLLTRSYATALSRMSPGIGLNRDHREYRAQARRIWTQYPRDRNKASFEVRQARHELHDCLRAIDRELENRSPSQSSDDSKFHTATSVFDYNVDSSDDGTRSPTSTFTRASTWSIERSLSPDHWDDNQDVLLTPTLGASFPTSNLQEGSYHNLLAEQAYESDDGPLPDAESPNRRWSRSDTTEVPLRYTNLSAIFQGTATKQRAKRDLGEWKPMPAAPAISRPEVEPRRPSSHSSLPRPVFSGSEAEAALVAMHKMSPPPTRGGRIRSPSRSERPPLSARSTNTQSALLGARSSDDANYHHKRQLSTSPRLLAAALFNSASRETRENIPSGYTSLPMSRDNSASSHLSLRTAPPAPLARPPSSPVPAVIRHIDADDVAFSHMNDWATSPASAVEDRLSVSFRGAHVQFGNMDPVSIIEAKERAEGARTKENR